MRGEANGQKTGSETRRRYPDLESGSGGLTAPQKERLTGAGSAQYKDLRKRQHQPDAKPCKEQRDQHRTVRCEGESPSIQIRGKNTISGSTDVLIVLDGIIYTGDISSINPADIERVDVLKDASATAVYGAQAANGVLLITSKRGNQGRAKITFSSSYSFKRPLITSNP